MGSIGKAYAILSGRLSGDREEASGLLESVPTQEKAARNRSETRMRGRRKMKKYKMGRKF